MISRNSAPARRRRYKALSFPFAGRLPWLAFFTLTLACVGGPPSRPQPGGGLTYLHDEVSNVPWSIHVLKIERSRPNFEFDTTLSSKGALISLGTMTEQMKAFPQGLGKPIAAINGDFWKNGRYDGDPEGLQIMRGELISSPGARSCFWIGTNGQPHATNVLSQLKVTWPNKAITLIGLNEERTNRGAVLYTSAVGASTRTKKGRELILEREGPGDWLPLCAGRTLAARVREVRESGNSALSTNTLVLSLSPQSSVPNVSRAAIGGGPVLVREGKAVRLTGGPARHPRTAIGWNDKFCFFVVVDGRQPKLSIGMSLQDLAAYMIKLGCQGAMNLDGGGSTTFWIYGNVMNSPCYGHERPMANALVLVQKPPNQNASHQSPAVHNPPADPAAHSE